MVGRLGCRMPFSGTAPRSKSRPASNLAALGPATHPGWPPSAHCLPQGACHLYRSQEPLSSRSKHQTLRSSQGGVQGRSQRPAKVQPAPPIGPWLVGGPQAWLIFLEAWEGGTGLGWTQSPAPQRYKGTLTLVHVPVHQTFSSLGS